MILFGTLAFICLATIGAANDIKWQGNWATGCDFLGNDLRSIKVPGYHCGQECWNNKDCTHFTFSDGTCKLKCGKVSKKDAVGGKSPEHVCGVPRESVSSSCPPPSKPHPTAPSKPHPTTHSKPQPTSHSKPQSASSPVFQPIGPVRQGHTTRYWDCCKPSCAWQGKIPSSPKAVVNTCSVKDGKTVLDANAQSACNGGEAVVCNSNQPWNVSSTLAYGFGVGKAPGLGEDKLCCACYKLDFIDGPVKGKTMVVQITNTGGDVDQTQFDLQIPVGGVGIFNGCSKQWNAPAQGWGDQYGGVHSRDDCKALPEQIRPGCQFRFDWFEGADNPKMTYVQVKCPKELTEKTGCQRSDE
jgi:hypothetical protein